MLILICSNNDVTPRYKDYNLNILNLNAKEACCVCGGVKEHHREI